MSNIDVKDLRIGNIVEFSDYPTKKSIKINLDTMRTVCSDVDWAKHFLSAIPLTEEWLLKCKEHEIDNDLYIIYDRFKLRYYKSYNYWCVSDLHDLSYVTKVEFLHEWQNVVFALTKKELEIK